LQTLGNDPAILTDEIGPDHLHINDRAPWYINLLRSWMDTKPLKEKLSHHSSLTLPLALFIMAFLLLMAGHIYMAIQLRGLELRTDRSQEISALQKHLQQIKGELHQFDELLIDQHEELLNKLEKAQSKTFPKVKSHQISVSQNPGPEELELKKWRHLGVGQNKHGGYALLHDGQETRMIEKNQFVKNQWRLSEFNSLEAVIVGPNEKRIVLSLQ
jgi:hypothetical protein